MKCNWSAFADFLYPREGTETCSYTYLSAMWSDFLYPREGTETHKCIHPPATDADFLYPREGTETALVFAQCLFLYRFSLSPRGDGNIPLLLMYLATSAGFSLSPRGDGNGHWHALLIENNDFLYPREGTETFYLCDALTHSHGIFFIPARGQKLYSRSKISFAVPIFFIPARGHYSQQKSTFLPSIYLQTVRNVLN